jgi:hypothetical protein
VAAGTSVAGTSVAGTAVAGASVAGAAVGLLPHAPRSKLTMMNRVSKCRVIFFTFFSFFVSLVIPRNWYFYIHITYF